MKYRGIFASSSDPSGQTLSKTIDGLTVVLSAILPVLALRFFHITLTANDVSSLVAEVTALVGTVMAIRGLILKIINKTATTTA